MTLVGRVQHPHHARCPARGSRQALNQQRALLGGREGASPPTAVTGRDCTKKVRPPAMAHSVSCGGPVVLLDRETQPSHLDHLVVGEHPATALDGVQVDALVLAVGPAHDLEVLRAHPDVEEAKAVLVDHIGVGLDHAADHDLALPEGRFDHDVVRSPRSRDRA